MDTSSSTLDFSDLFNFPDSSSSALDDPPLSAGPFDAAFPASTGEQPSDDWDAYFAGTALDGACGGGGWDYGTLGGQHAGGGVELMDIAPHPDLIPKNPPYHQYPPPHSQPSLAYQNQFPPDLFPLPSLQHPTPPQHQSTSSPSSSSQHSSLPLTPPSTISLPPTATAHPATKRARTSLSPAPSSTTTTSNPYAVSNEASSSRGSTEPEAGEDSRMAGEEKEGGEQKRTGKGKKRKQLPTTAEFQHPDVSGLSKKEARLVKNRAAAFLSRQRKREQFDEMEVEVVALRAENAHLRKLLSSSSSSSSITGLSQPQPTVAAPPPALAPPPPPAAPAINSAVLISLQTDLANIRSLLHASMSREASLQVELASLRQQRISASSASASGVQPCPSPSAAVAMRNPTINADLNGQNAASSEEVGHRQIVALGKRDREGKRVGGVALMVILFSFALFSLPNLPSLPIRSATHSSSSSSSSSSFPSFLGRVLQAGGPGAGLPPSSSSFLLNSTTSASSSAPSSSSNTTETEDADDVCDESSKHAHLHQDSPAPTCADPSPPARSSPESLENVPVSKQLAHWTFPASHPLSSRQPGNGGDVSRRSFALTLLRPVPTSGTGLNTASVESFMDSYGGGAGGKKGDDDDGVEDVLERWLGLNLLDGGAGDLGGRVSEELNESWSSSSPTTPGWMVLETPSLELIDGPPSSSSSSSGGNDVPTAWDGQPLEPMEIDQAVSSYTPPPPSSSPLPSIPPSPSLSTHSFSSDSTIRAPSSPPRLLTLPSSSSSQPKANETDDGAAVGAAEGFLRLDLELELGVRKRDVSLLGREEVNRMMRAASVGGGGGGKGGGTPSRGWPVSMGF